MTKDRSGARQLLAYARKGDLYREIAENILDMIAVFDPEGLYLYASPNHLPILGYAQGELIGARVLDFVHADDRDEASRLLGDCLGKGRCDAEKFRLRGKSGEYHWFQVSVNSLGNRGGDPWLIVASMRDIEDRMSLEDELFRNQERLNYIVSASPAVIYAAEPRKKFACTFMSENVRTQFGFDPADFTEDPAFWASRIHPEDERASFEEILPVFECGFHSHEYRFMRKDGRYRWVRDDLHLVRDEDGLPIEIIGSLFDIEERKLAEEELKSRNAELETQKLLADASNRAKSEFIANISHELTTPLNAIIGFSQTLLDGHSGDLGVKQREYLGYVLKAGKDLHSLIKSMIDFSEMDAYGKLLDTSGCLLRELILSVTTLFTEEAHARGITILTAFEPGCPTSLEVDVAKIKQALFHLLSNAVKYSPKGGVVRVRARASEEGGEERIEIEIRDEGPGIERELLPQLFELFWQKEAPYTKRFKGVGIGLKLVKKIADLHQGSLRVESEVGRGSVFTLAIPRRTATAAVNEHFGGIPHE